MTLECITRYITCLHHIYTYTIYTMTYIRTEICICQNWKALIGTPKQLTSVWSHRSRIMNLKFQHHILNMFQHHVPWPLAWPRLPHWPRGRQRQETWWPKFAAVAGRRGLSTSCCMVWKKLETWVTSSLQSSLKVCFSNMNLLHHKSCCESSTTTGYWLELSVAVWQL